MRILAFIICLLFAAPAYAGITEDVLGKKEPSVPAAQAPAAAPVMRFCKEGEAKDACYARFQEAFHIEMNALQALHKECLGRMTKPIPDDVFKAFAATPQITVSSGQKINLSQFVQVFMAENSAAFTACQLAMFHELQDRLARAFGVEAPHQDYLKYFDELMKNGGGTPHK